MILWVHKMFRKQLSQAYLGRWLVALILLIGLSTLPASATVTLIRFEAKPDPVANTFKIEWETATELDSLLFRVYRSQVQLPLNSTDWGASICSEAAKGSGLIGATYACLDPNPVTPGVRYWYLLEEVTSSNLLARIMVTSAGIDVPTLTPTSTATPTLTSTPSPTGTQTSTQQPGTNQPAATATQRYTNTPPPPAAVLITPTSTQLVQPTATSLPPAVLSTPTGSAPAATLFVPAASPTPGLPTAQAPEATQPAAAATVAVIAQQQPGAETTKTPVVIAAKDADKPAGAAVNPDAASGSSRNTQRLLLFGGGAIVVAALAIAGVFAIRARRS